MFLQKSSSDRGPGSVMRILGQFQKDAVGAVEIDQLLAGLLPGLDRREEGDAVALQGCDGGGDVVDGKGEMAQADTVGTAEGGIGAAVLLKLQQFDSDIAAGMVQGDKTPLRPGEAGNLLQKGGIKGGGYPLDKAEEAEEGAGCFEVADDDVEVVDTGDHVFLTAMLGHLWQGQENNELKINYLNFYTIKVYMVNMVDKRKPTYDIDAFKAAFASVDKLAVTGTALRSAAALGCGRTEIVAVIQTIQRSHFYKSMTAYADSRLWQDVYHVPSPLGLLM